MFHIVRKHTAWTAGTAIILVARLALAPGWKCIYNKCMLKVCNLFRLRTFSTQRIIYYRYPGLKPTGLPRLWPFRPIKRIIV